MRDRVARGADASTSRFYAHLVTIDDRAARLLNAIDMPSQRRKSPRRSASSAPHSTT